jgi:hypothetical protein
MKLTAKNKWRFAIGTTSLVPSTLDCRKRCPIEHYVICDVDDGDITPTLSYLTNDLGVTRAAIYPTPHGWHIFTPLQMRWRLLLWTLRRVPGVDSNWLRIGERRGYLFLADKKPVKVDWPVVRMVLHNGKIHRPRH